MKTLPLCEPCGRKRTSIFLPSRYMELLPLCASNIHCKHLRVQICLDNSKFFPKYKRRCTKNGECDFKKHTLLSIVRIKRKFKQLISKSIPLRDDKKI